MLIMIADDDIGFRSILRDHLQDEGYEVVVVADASQLATELAKRLPTAVIADMQMPAGGGIAAVRLVRGQTSAVVIPVLMCSGMPVEMTRKWFDGVAKLGVLQKPAELTVISAELTRLINEP